MRLRMRFGVNFAIMAAVFSVLLTSNGTALSAGEVLLKNGMRIEGTPVPIAGLTNTLIHQTRGPTNTYPVIMVDTGMQRYFVHRRQVQEIENIADLSRYETFKLKQPRRGRRKMVSVVGAFSSVGPFDEFGRRTVTLHTRKKVVPVVQGIVEITPVYLKLNGITHDWEYSISTKSVPVETLYRIIRTAIDPTDPDQRLAVVRFSMQAEHYTRAFAEIDSIAKDFPELKSTLDDVSLKLRTFFATEILHEVQRRRSAGQHRLAYAATKRFPMKRMSQAVLRDVREMSAEYEDAGERIKKSRMLLGDLQSTIQDKKLRDKVMPLRSIVSSELDYESLDRLEAFLRFADDESLAPKEKLAMAYSGWILGGGNAVTDLQLTIRLWEARFMIREYLRTEDSFKHQDLLRKLRDLEGAGATKIAAMIPYLPPLIETPDIQPGKIHQIEISTKNETPDNGSENPDEKSEGMIRYSVLLPPEYNSHHRYPLVVSLRPNHRSAEKQMAWWAGTETNPGQSQRHGYIVIVPEYLEENAKKYNYSSTAHNVVLQSIRNVRKRFSVDSDRIFLSGHGIGGDAAFDIGMSHPDLFAGVIPITGMCDQYCKWYWKNAKHVAWYVVGGERDRDSLARNSRDLYRMMQEKFDIVYVEYIARGYEPYYDEIERIFDWMALHRRTKYVKEVEAKILRPTDNRFYWIEASEFARNVTQSTVLSETRVNPVSPMRLEARVKPGNTIYLRSVAKYHTLYLSPQIVDFDQKVNVKFRGSKRSRFNDFVGFDIKVMLDDFQRRGDRQKLYWAKIEI